MGAIVNRFRTAMLHQFGLDEGQELTPLQEHWIDYALTTNKRGAQLVDSVESFFGSLDGKTWLDVGSGYGGLAIAAARRGAIATGIEYDPRLISIAEENLADQGSLEVGFVTGDIHDPGSLPEGQTWDVITLDNVIEHVRSPFQVYQRLASLLSPDGVVYIVAPNGRSLDQIRSDGHYQLFGISLLSPPRGAEYLREALPGIVYDVTWLHRRSEYEAMARTVGLESHLVNGGFTTGETVKALKSKSRALRADLEGLLGGVPDGAREEVRFLVAEVLEDCEAALAHAERLDSADRKRFLAEVQREFVDEVFLFVLRHPGSRAPLPTPRHVMWGYLGRRSRHILDSWNVGGEVGSKR